MSGFLSASRQLIVFAFIISIANTVQAGGVWAKARVIYAVGDASENFVVEIQWVDRNGLTSGSPQKKFAFRYLIWPNESRRWFWNLLPWTPRDEVAYKLAEFDSCKRYLSEAFKAETEVNIGQMGTAKFRSLPDASDTALVPFAKIIESEGSTACMLFAAPV